MPFQIISGLRRYQQAAEQIAVLIKAGEFAATGRLPAERDLARALGVSRPTVREALIALEIAGLIDVRTGSGAYLRPPGPERESTPRGTADDAGPSAFELLGARRLLEPPVAAHAAQTITADELETIMEAIELQDRQRNGTHWEKLEADRLFHTRIAAATHNAVVIGMVEELWKGMFGPIFAILSERTQLTHQQSMTLDDHRLIHACLERRDGPGAHAAMLSHLLHVETTLLKADEARRIV
jgi:DNA-binding FadR family transcriptional regulator